MNIARSGSNGDAEPLDASFDAVHLARARVPTAGRRSKSRSLIQRVVAGLGNIYASEALHCAPDCHRGAKRRRLPPHADDRARLRSYRPARSRRSCAARSAATAPVSIRRLPRVRPGGREMLSAGMRRDDSSHPAGGTLDVLLSELSALNGTNLRPYDAETQNARRRCRTLRASAQPRRQPAESTDAARKE